MKTIAAILALTLAGCAMAPGWPGYISDDKSDFDGARVISVYPGAASGCCSLGAAWSNRDPDYIQITAVLMGANYAVISDAMEFSIDGRTVKLPATRELTQFKSTPGIRSSSKTFVMRRADFNAMLAAKQLGVRISTLSGSAEGDLTRDAIVGSAIEGFRSFAKRLP